MTWWARSHAPSPGFAAGDRVWCNSMGLSGWVRDAAPGGVDVHVDTSGRHDLAAAVDLLAKDGRGVLCPERR